MMVRDIANMTGAGSREIRLVSGPKLDRYMAAAVVHITEASTVAVSQQR